MMEYNIMSLFFDMHSLAWVLLQVSTLNSYKEIDFSSCYLCIQECKRPELNVDASGTCSILI
jgi:hypothetical protein